MDAGTWKPHNFGVRAAHRLAILATALVTVPVVVPTDAFAERVAPRDKPGAQAKPAEPTVWVGTFIPKDHVTCQSGCESAKPVAKPGQVRVLTPSKGQPATGPVMIVQPVLKAYGAGTVANGVVQLVSFPYDENRDTDNNVLVVPSGTKAILVEPTKADIASIKATLLKSAEELENIKRSVAGLEVTGVDTDGDGKADLAVTYGCNAWGDGACQSRGQFFLARRGQRWVVID